MYVIEARNVNGIYAELVRLIRREGVTQSSRAGEVLVLPAPVMLVTHRPLERVLLDPRRDANPFFFCFESLFLLAGRDDYTWLDRFVRDFSARFGEPDGRGHGSYGKRWRSHFGFDQIDTVVSKLRADPNDRRVVIQMWDAGLGGDLYQYIGGNEYQRLETGADDLRIDARDIPCLTGETLLWSPEPQRDLATLARQFERGDIGRWPVFTVDPKTKQVEINWATNVWRSGRKKVIKITFDDGTHLRCTPDHILYQRSKRAVDAWPIEAGSLQIGDRVLATHTWVGPKGHLSFKRSLAENTRFSNTVMIHREYADLLFGETPVGYVVHHVDEDSTNNTMQNLAVISESEHNRLHRLGDKNPMRRMTPEQRKARAEKHSEALRRSWSQLTPQQRSARARGVPLPDNHVIVSIEEDGEEDVYDFTVPGTHTAIVGSGIVVHNCNTHIYPRIVDGRLDLTVCCRSNDAIWGAAGANAVQFSMLLEYLAGRIGVQPGRLYQLANNMHLYTARSAKYGEPSYRPYWPDVYDDPIPIGEVTPIGTDWGHWDEDLQAFMKWANAFNKGQYETLETYNVWFRSVALSMWKVHDLFSTGNPQRAIECTHEIAAPDWRLAAQSWVKRRMK